MTNQGVWKVADEVGEKLQIDFDDWKYDLVLSPSD